MTPIFAVVTILTFQQLLYQSRSIGGDVTITGNPSMQFISMEHLNTIDGSLSLHMETIIGTPITSAGLIGINALQIVGGNINITGPVKALGLGGSDMDIT